MTATPLKPVPLTKTCVTIFVRNQILLQNLLDLCQLAGVPAKNGFEHATPKRHTAHLVLTEASVASFGAFQTAPRVVVGLASETSSQKSSVDLVLPGNEPQLLRLLSEWASGEPGAMVDSSVGSEPFKRGIQVVLVGAWHGGGGATATAFALADSLTGVVLDAAGNGGGPTPGEGAPVWEDLRAEDLPAGPALVAALPRFGKVPYVSSLAAPTVRADRAIVQQLSRSLPRPVVVDCGSDLHSLAQARDNLVGTRLVTVLVGMTKYQHVARLGKHLASFKERGTFQGAHLLQVGGTSSLVGELADRFGCRHHRAPALQRQRNWRDLANMLEQS